MDLSLKWIQVFDHVSVRAVSRRVLLMPFATTLVVMLAGGDALP